MKGGILKLIIGPMFSSKSTYLISEINRYKNITNKILVINNNLDKDRYNYKIKNNKNLDVIKTYNGETFPCILLTNLNDINTNEKINEMYKNSEIIVIDEGQFYPDLYDFINRELNELKKDKIFIVAGLSSDFNMKPIGDITKLISIADKIINLRAICEYCKNGTKASFTNLIKDNTNTKFLIGSNECYSPCCRKHHENKN